MVYNAGRQAHALPVESVMALIRGPLRVIGAIVLAMEIILAGTLFALGYAPVLQMAVAIAMSAVFAAFTLVALGLLVYLTLKNPGALFSPWQSSD